MYGNGQMGPLASDHVMREHFTAAFISVWKHALARSDITIIDADPFTGQGVNSFKLQRVGIIAQTPNSATVDMGDKNSPHTVPQEIALRQSRSPTSDTWGRSTGGES
jgi:hypothetical protein